jgi:hypothetical protein
MHEGNSNPEQNNFKANTLACNSILLDLYYTCIYLYINMYLYVLKQSLTTAWLRFPHTLAGFELGSSVTVMLLHGKCYNL